MRNFFHEADQPLTAEPAISTAAAPWWSTYTYTHTHTHTYTYTHTHTYNHTHTHTYNLSDRPQVVRFL